MAMEGASGEQHTKARHRANCDATKRDMHHSARHTRGSQTPGKPSLAGSGEE